MALRDKYPLSGKKVIKKTISRVIGTAGSIGFFFLCVISSGGLLLPILAAFILLGIPALGAICYLYEKEYFRTYHYDLNDNGLEIRKGVFFPNSITLPLEKISDVYVDQDIFDRYFGLYDLHYSSASISSGNLSHIDGMDKETTEGLKLFLMAQIRHEGMGAPDKAGMAAKEGSVLASFRPEPAGYWVSLIGSGLGMLLLLTFTFPPLVLLSPILAIPLAIYMKKEFDTQVYNIRSDGVYVKRGWLSPSETLIFYKNIQDIDMAQGLLEMLSGLQTLTVKSMSAQSAISSRFNYLSEENAKKMHQMIAAEIEKNKKENAQPARAGIGRAGMAAQQARVPGYSGQDVVCPYKNEFVKGALVSSLPFYGGAAAVGIALAIAGIFEPMLIVIGAVFLVIALLLAGLAYINAIVESSVYTYALTREGLVIQTGLFSKFKKTIRYDKIQDVRLYCGFLESFLGLATINVETGSKDIGEGSSAQLGAIMTERIPSLNLRDAYALRTQLLDIAGIRYPQGADPLRNSMPLSPKKPLKKTVAGVGIISAQIFIALLLGCVLLPQPISWIAIGLFALFILIIGGSIPIRMWYETQYMQKYYYDENKETLVIRKGVFGWSEIVVPYRNIQSIYVDQDIYDVYFDTWDVWITTVTLESGPMAHIDGLERADAERLARLLVDRVEKARKL